MLRHYGQLEEIWSFPFALTHSMGSSGGGAVDLNPAVN